jgi:hypothetical protein
MTRHFAAIDGRGLTVEADIYVDTSETDGNISGVIIDDATEFAAALSTTDRDKLRAALQVARLTDDLDATVKELTPRGLRDVIRAATDALMEAAAND